MMNKKPTYFLKHTRCMYMSYVGKWVANGYMCCNI